MFSRGLTLIELLVTVAIIAVLAGVVVANLLDAQERSRVSRVQNDMRVSAIALEAYHADCSMYPLRPIDFNNLKSYQMALPTSLTTPVAYLHGKLDDPYGPRVLGLGYKYMDWGNLANPNLPQSTGSFRDGYYAYGDYSVFSDGPDMKFGPRGYSGKNHVSYPYDATNGIVSSGDLHRSRLDPQGLPRV